MVAPVKIPWLPGFSIRNTIDALALAARGQFLQPAPARASSQRPAGMVESETVVEKELETTRFTLSGPWGMEPHGTSWNIMEHHGTSL